ncbi:MAG: hypothetical protein QXE38_04035 [Candidatus Methanomethylicia archaeon]
MEVFQNEWFWIIVISIVLIVVVPLVVVWGIMQLSPELKLAATIIIVIFWGITSGYKDWIISKRRKEEKT